MKTVGWGARIRTWECRYQKPVPYHLATPQPDPPAATERARYRVGRADATALCGERRTDLQLVPGQGDETSAHTTGSARPTAHSVSACTPVTTGLDAAVSALQGLTGLAINPASVRSIAQPGRAPSSGGGGRKFKSCYSDHLAPPRPWTPFSIASGTGPGPGRDGCAANPS